MLTENQNIFALGNIYRPGIGISVYSMQTYEYRWLLENELMILSGFLNTEKVHLRYRQLKFSSEEMFNSNPKNYKRDNTGSAIVLNLTSLLTNESFDFFPDRLARNFYLVSE